MSVIHDKTTLRGIRPEPVADSWRGHTRVRALLSIIIFRYFLLSCRRRIRHYKNGFGWKIIVFSDVKKRRSEIN